MSTYPIFLWWCMCVYSSICLFISMCSWMQAGILLPSYLFIYLYVLLSIYLSWRWWFYKWHKTFIITNTVLNPTININLSIFYLLTYLPILYYIVLSIRQYIFLYWTIDILPLHKLALYILSYWSIKTSNQKMSRGKSLNTNLSLFYLSATHNMS